MTDRGWLYITYSERRFECLEFLEKGIKTKPEVHDNFAKNLTGRLRNWKLIREFRNGPIEFWQITAEGRAALEFWRACHR